MSCINFAIIGGGWRAAFYARIARALPEQFKVSAVLVRRDETARLWASRYSIPAVYTLDDLMKTDPEFVVLSITKPDIANMLCELMRKRIPVLCETPPAITHECLEEVWRVYLDTGTRVQVAEQYIHQPYYACWLNAVKEGLLGDITNMTVGSVHGYHAVSLFRRFLGAGFSGCRIIGAQRMFPVCSTATRNGIAFDPAPREIRHDRLELCFDNGKIGYYEFSPEQYISQIRCRQFSVQGTKGEINQLNIFYVNEHGDSIKTMQRRLDMGIYQNLEWSHFGIQVGDRFLYKNPFPNARLNDDELAMAQSLLYMAGNLENGQRAGYSLEEALQDAYIALLMEQAANDQYHWVQTTDKPWQTQRWNR